MRYLILGPLEVHDGPRAVALTQGRQRLLLAVLLLHRDEIVSSERLIDLLWGETPPRSAAASLHNLVSGLRKALGDGRVVTHGHGYALTVEEVDADEFETLAAGSRAALADGLPERAAALAREALALWRGPPLADLAYEPAVATAVARLEELRLSIVEDRVDADLALGRHTALVAELAELVAQFPARERLRGQQMLALYRCDRQAEALETYQDFRRRLGHELGLTPAPALRALEQAILEHDPALAAPHRRPALPTRRSRGRLAFGAAAALALAVVLGVFARDEPSLPAPVRVAPDSLTVIDPAGNRVTASYPVGTTPASVSVGAGAAWTVSADARTISRVDLRQRTTKTFATGSVPLEVAASRDALWFVAGDWAARDTPFEGAPAQPSRIGPNSTSVAASTTLEPSTGPATRAAPGLVAVGAGAVWTIARDGRLGRLDPVTGRSRTVAGVSALLVAAGDGQAWAVAATEDDQEPNLLRLDPASGRVVDRLRVSYASIGSLAVGAGAVWITDPYAGVVWRIDPGPRATQRTIDVDFGVDGVAAAPGSVWVSDSVTGTVSRIDPTANRVTARIAVGGTPRAIALGGGQVWVAVAGGDRRVVSALPPGAKAKPLGIAGCGPVLSAPGASPDLLIAADLPAQGRFESTTQPMAAAIASVLRSHHFQAGRFRIALQTCDDSIAQSGGPDERKCTANGRAYARNPTVIGVVGPVNSFCAAAMLPVLNRSSVPLVSPTNSRVSLVRPGPGDLRALYPTGQRGYARVIPPDDATLAAAAIAARDLAPAGVMYLSNRDEAGNDWSEYFRRGARRIGLRIVGTAAWDPKGSSFRPLARRVRASGAQGVVINGSIYQRVGAVVRALRAELGADFPIVATDEAMPVSQLFAEAGEAARGVRIVLAGLQPERLGADGRRWTRAFAATQPGGRVSQFAVYAAAATEVLLDAIARSDGTRASVVRALAVTHLATSPIGPIALDARGEVSVAQATVIRAERGGAPAFVDGAEGSAIERVITLPAGAF